MFKIGEFSKITQVSVRMLRYYDENGLLKPAETDAVTGYRQYQARQIEELNQIISLRDMGFGIKEIRDILEYPSPETIRSSMEKQLQKTEAAIRLETEKKLRLEEYLRELAEPCSRPDIQIIMKALPSCHVVCLRRRVENYYCEGMLWQELSARFSNCDAKQSFSIYHDLDYREEDVDIEVCVVVPEHSRVPDGLVYRQIPAVERSASFVVHGDYSQISPAYRKFGYWLEKHPEYVMSGENRQICHVAACHTGNPAEYVTELQIPLNRRAV